MNRKEIRMLLVVILLGYTINFFALDVVVINNTV